MRAAALLAGCLLVPGCITTPLEERSWLAVQTPHYDIWSSLGEDETRRLATSVERFRVAVAYLWGGEIPPAPVRTRIFAFDDHGIGRVFAFGRDRSYLLARHDGDVIVLRTGEGWGGDARTALKLAYARRLIRGVATDTLPPWLEEGMAQLASTVEVRGVGASLGSPPGDHINSLREEQWIPFDRLLGATDLVAWTDRERAHFEQQAWALCHYLRMSEARTEATPAQLAHLPARIERGEGALVAAQAALGSGLQRAVWTHVSAAELPLLSVRIPHLGPEPSLRPVPRAEILEELAALALAIDERELAARYLSAASAGGESSARVLAAMGAILEAEGDPAAADAHYAAALERAPGDPLLWAARADQLREDGARTADGAERRALADRAREHYRRAIDLAPGLPAAHAGLAATFLLEGEDPSAGREPVLAARRLLPGDAAIRALDARLRLAAGDWKGAREEAVRLVTRARSEAELRDARALLDAIDRRTPVDGPALNEPPAGGAPARSP